MALQTNSESNPHSAPPSKINVGEELEAESQFRSELLELSKAMSDPILDNRASSNKNMLLLTSVVLAALSTGLAKVDTTTAANIKDIPVTLNGPAVMFALLALPVFYAVAYLQDLIRCWQLWNFRQSALRYELAVRANIYRQDLETSARNLHAIEDRGMVSLSEVTKSLDKKKWLDSLREKLVKHMQLAVEEYDGKLQTRNTGTLGWSPVPDSTPLVEKAINSAMGEAGDWLALYDMESFRRETVSELVSALRAVTWKHTWRDVLRELVNRIESHEGRDWRKVSADISVDAAEQSIKSRIRGQRVDRLLSTVSKIGRIKVFAFTWDVMVPFFFLVVAMALYLVAEIS